MTALSAQQVEAIRGRCEAATPGPWAWDHIGDKTNGYVVGLACLEDGTPLSGQLSFDGCVNSDALVEQILYRGYLGEHEASTCNYGDPEFICHARTDLPLVLDAYAALAARFTAPIVCICGSTRFKQTWINENARLTGEGNIVLSVGFWGHHERIAPSPEIKQQLDALHKRKIDLCDWVWVVDVGGYVGDSTKSEISYALEIGRPVKYLSSYFPDYVDPVDPLAAELERCREALKDIRHICTNDITDCITLHDIILIEGLVAAALCAPAKGELSPSDQYEWDQAQELGRRSSQA